jgi:hypothetical protein
MPLPTQFSTLFARMSPGPRDAVTLFDDLDGERREPDMKSVRLMVVMVAASIAVSAMTGCVRVAPYERGTLAHPTMAADDPFTSPLDEHVRAVSEGASGGLSGGGGGCGCN